MIGRPLRRMRRKMRIIQWEGIEKRQERMNRKHGEDEKKGKQKDEERGREEIEDERMEE